MDGSDHRKLAVIGKSKTPHCLQKKYKMNVNDMAVDWYASKNTWITGDIHHKILTKFNNQMRITGCHVLYVCDNASSYQAREYSHIKFLMSPVNATSILQPLDQGIMMSAKRRYKAKLAERYLMCVENNKDANALLKSLDIVAEINMIAKAWRETSATIIQNCFHKAGFKHHCLDPETQPEEPPVAPAPAVWNKVTKRLGGMEFDEFAASEPDVPTTQPMTDEDIVDLVHTENDVPQEESENGKDIPTVSMIKNITEFLANIAQRRAFLKRYNVPVELVEQLETLIVGNQFALCKKQKQIDDYFKSVSDSPNPKDNSTADIYLVDSLVDMDMSNMELQSIDTTVASVAVSALLRDEVTPDGTSTPKHVCPATTTPQKEAHQCMPIQVTQAGTNTPMCPSQSMAIPQNPVTPACTTTSKHWCLSVPQAPKKKLKLNAAIDKVMMMNNSDVSLLESSDSDLFSSQE